MGSGELPAPHVDHLCSNHLREGVSWVVGKGLAGVQEWEVDVKGFFWR